MEKEKIANVRRCINDSYFGRTVNDRHLEVIVEALSLRLNALVRGKENIELPNNQLYYSYSHCFGKGISDVPSNISVGVLYSLKSFHWKKLCDHFLELRYKHH